MEMTIADILITFKKKNNNSNKQFDYLLFEYKSYIKYKCYFWQNIVYC